MPRRVLVTGGCGFIGRHVVEALLKRNYTVVVVDDLSGRGSTPPGDEEIIFHEIDLRKTQPKELFEGVDICIALAARVGGVRYVGANQGSILRDNLQILCNTFESACSRVRRLVYVSSSSVFDTVDQRPVTESMISFATIPQAGYPFSKLAGEALCKAYFQQYQLPYTIIRPFNVYGRGELPGMHVGDAHVIPDLVRKIVSDSQVEILGDGQQTRSFTHVSDVVAGILLAMENPEAANEDFNFGHQKELKILELVRQLWILCGRNDELRVSYIETGYPDVRRRAVSIAKAKKLLGWTPKVGLAEGLPEVVEWLKAHLPSLLPLDSHHS